MLTVTDKGKLTEGRIMTDPKTTITALVTGVAGLLAYFDILIPEAWVTPIVFVGTMLLGFFASDKKKD